MLFDSFLVLVTKSENVDWWKLPLISSQMQCLAAYRTRHTSLAIIMLICSLWWVGVHLDPLTSFPQVTKKWLLPDKSGSYFRSWLDKTLWSHAVGVEAWVTYQDWSTDKMWKVKNCVTLFTWSELRAWSAEANVTPFSTIYLYVVICRPSWFLVLIACKAGEGLGN